MEKAHVYIEPVWHAMQWLTTSKLETAECWDAFAFRKVCAFMGAEEIHRSTCLKEQWLLLPVLSSCPS